MSKQVVSTPNAPKARSVNSQAIVANGFVFISGQLPHDLEGNIVGENVQDRTVYINDHWSFITRC